MFLSNAFQNLSHSVHMCEEVSPALQHQLLLLKIIAHVENG